MARIDIIEKLKSNHKSALDFNYDSLMAPPIYSILTPTDIGDLNSIATSIKLSSKIKKKYQMMDEIMGRRGFREFHAGTNRRIYSFPDYKYLMAKVAIDDSGIPDNIREYKNQFLIKPYCTKVFDVTQCSTVGFFERFIPIQTRQEFLSVADDIFTMITEKLIGKYVIADIGTNYFMNWGVRKNFGVGLLDFPYIYELDGDKLQCNHMFEDGTFCDGTIDYDDGFNHLICNKCGKVYQAVELQKSIENNDIIIERRQKFMQIPNIVVKVGNKVIYDDNKKIKESKKIERSNKPIKHNYAKELNITVKCGDAEVIDGEIISNPVIEKGLGEELMDFVNNDLDKELKKSRKEDADALFEEASNNKVSGTVTISEESTALNNTSSTISIDLKNEVPKEMQSNRSAEILDTHLKTNNLKFEKKETESDIIRDAIKSISEDNYLPSGNKLEKNTSENTTPEESENKEFSETKLEEIPEEVDSKKENSSENEVLSFPDIESIVQSDPNFMDEINTLPDEDDKKKNYPAKKKNKKRKNTFSEY